MIRRYSNGKSISTINNEADRFVDTVEKIIKLLYNEPWSNLSMSVYLSWKSYWKRDVELDRLKTALFKLWNVLVTCKTFWRYLCTAVSHSGRKHFVLFSNNFIRLDAYWKMGTSLRFLHWSAKLGKQEHRKRSF